MIAAVYNGNRVLELREVPHPVVEPGGLIIAVQACGICATDLKIVEQEEVKMKRSHLRQISLPRIIGHEIVGEIVEVGREAIGYRIGDRVAIAPSIPCGRCYYCHRSHFEMCDDLLVVGYDIDGGFAEFMSVPSQALEMGCANIVPSDMSFEEAVLTEPLSCVINAFELTPVEEGDSVVVIGAGPMGCLHVEVARLRGASKIILVDRIAQRLQMARMSNADIYVLAREESLEERILRETEGRGADVVFVAASSKAAQEQALALVGKHSRVNLFAGLPRGEGLVCLDTNLIHYKECLLTGTHGSTPRQNLQALELLADEGGRLKKYVTHAFSLNRINEAFAEMRRYAGMKTVILPGEAT